MHSTVPRPYRSLPCSQDSGCDVEEANGIRPVLLADVAGRSETRATGPVLLQSPCHGAEFRTWRVQTRGGILPVFKSGGFRPGDRAEPDGQSEC